jgi:hypothetical protein
MNPVKVIIPSIKSVESLTDLIANINETAGYPHSIIPSCGPHSASVNRNRMLFPEDELVVMVDDDVILYAFNWLRILVEALKRPEVVMVSSQLYRANGSTAAYMTGLQDWGGLPKHSGETVVPTKRLLTACCAFKPMGCRFDEAYVGSGFEDVDYCNQLSALKPDGVFLICHDSKVIHLNEQRGQRGENWLKNKTHYESKWGPVESHEELIKRYKP